MWDESDILSKAWLVREAVNLVLPSDMSVNRIFLIGSYAKGNANEWSDLDLLVELNGKKKYPSWEQITEISKVINHKRIHVIYGCELTQESLRRKRGDKFAYREICITTFGVNNGPFKQKAII